MSENFSCLMDRSSLFNTISLAASLGSTGWSGTLKWSISNLKSVNFIFNNLGVMLIEYLRIKLNNIAKFCLFYKFKCKNATSIETTRFSVHSTYSTGFQYSYDPVASFLAD